MVCFRRFGGLAVPFPLDSSAFETEFWVAQTHELLRKWEGRRVHPRMEITGDELMLGAGTILAKMMRVERGAPRLSLSDEARAMALLATAYERLISPYVLEKIGRAAELWNEGEKALAHIHLAYAGLPPCTDEQALRLFVADELLDSGVAPAELMKAQGFDLSPLALLKFPGQPRVPAGSGRESGEWSGGTGENIINVAGGPHENEKERSYEERRAKGEEQPKEDIEHGRPVPLVPEGPLAPPPPSGGALEPGQVPEIGTNKLHHIFGKRGRGLDSLVTDYGSQEAAFEAIKNATQEVVKQRNISGVYEIEITVRSHKLTVRGNVMNDGALKIGTVFP
jgi:hypothetical protein